MIREKRFEFNLDTVAGVVTGFLLLAVSVVVIIGTQLGVRVTAQLPRGNLSGPFEALTLVFSEPVDEWLAIEKFSIQPDVRGTFQWADPRTLHFIPLAPFQPDVTYTLAISSGELTVNGGVLKKPRTWKFEVRPPRVAYMTVDGQTSRLWTIEPASGTITPLTPESFRILDFDAARNGEFVVFSMFNEQKGLDLWRVGRAGNDAVLLLDCGPDRCTVPAISPDGRRVAYVREAAGPTPDLEYGAPRIWVFDMVNRRNASLYEDQQILGYRPLWSPDGTRLVSFDGLADELRLLDLLTGEQLIIPTSTGSPVAWSTDGSSFLFTDIESTGLGLHTRVRQAKLSLKETVTLLGENDERNYAYNSLAWSPDGDRLLVGLQPDEYDPSVAFWLLDPVSLGGQVIVHQPGYVYNTPFWDPWGRMLIFQQFSFTSVYKPEIGLWAQGLKEPRLLAEGIMPRWLP